MKSNLIISGRDNPPKPYIALVLSLFFPGLGHVYCGTLSRGSVFALALCLGALMIPFGLTATGHTTSLYTAIILTSLYILVYFLCLADALLRSLRSDGRTAKRYTTVTFYAAASLVSLALNVLSLSPAFSLYSFQYITNDTMKPSFQNGDVVLVAGYSSSRVTPGDVLLIEEGGARKIARLIAREGDRVRYGNGRFEVNGVPLSLGVDIINQENTVNSGGSDDRYYEVIQDRKYGITIDLNKSAGALNYTGEISIPDGILLVAFDNRLIKEEPISVSLSSLRGRVEGTITGKGRNRLFILPHSPN